MARWPGGAPCSVAESGAGGRHLCPEAGAGEGTVYSPHSAGRAEVAGAERPVVSASSRTPHSPAAAPPRRCSSPVGPDYYRAQLIKLARVASGEWRPADTRSTFYISRDAPASPRTAPHRPARSGHECAAINDALLIGVTRGSAGGCGALRGDQPSKWPRAVQ